jgi:chromosome segregation ATPase
MEALRAELATWKGRAESQRDTIAGDRKQINILKAEIDALQGVNGNLTHDRDAMTAEVDRLTGLLTEALKAQETALGQEEAYRARWAREHQSKVISQVVSLIACVLASGIVLAVVMGGGK